MAGRDDDLRRKIAEYRESRPDFDWPDEESSVTQIQGTGHKIVINTVGRGDAHGTVGTPSTEPPRSKWRLDKKTIAKIVAVLMALGAIGKALLDEVQRR